MLTEVHRSNGESHRMSRVLCAVVVLSAVMLGRVGIGRAMDCDGTK